MHSVGYSLSPMCNLPVSQESHRNVLSLLFLPVVPVKGCRTIAKKDMVFNNRTPKITVDPETYEVTVDGESITSKPAQKLPLTQLYNLF